MGAEDSDYEPLFKRTKYPWEDKLSGNKAPNNVGECSRSVSVTGGVSAIQNHEESGSLESYPSSSSSSSNSRERPIDLPAMDPYNVYLSHSENLMSLPFNIGVNDEDFGSHLVRWQARQLAKSFVDNAMNHTLETLRERFPGGITSFVASYSNGERDCIIGDEMDNDEDSNSLYYQSDNNIRTNSSDDYVEDEGILMAIQSHGLQSDRPIETNTNNCDQATSSTRDTSPAPTHTLTNFPSQAIVTPEYSGSAGGSIRALSTPNQYVEHMDTCTRKPATSTTNMGSGDTCMSANHNQVSHLPEPEETLTINYTSSSGNFELEYGENNNEGKSLVNCVLDAAIGAAIQKKGLISNCIEF